MQPQAVLLTVPAQCVFPQACANCGAHANTQLSVSQQISKVTRSYLVPHCQTCVSRQQSHTSKRTSLWLLVVAAAIGTALLGVPLRTHAVVGFFLAIVLSFAFGMGVFFLLKPKPPVAPATSSVEAIKLTSWNANTSYFYCTNHEWAAHAAHASGGQVGPCPPRPYGAHAHVVSAVMAAFAASFVVWGVCHPTVCFHNSTDKPMAFWVDGKQELVLEPGKHQTSDVAYGSRALGWSATGASKPERSITGQVTIGKAHLVNPDEAGCYWVTGAQYGTAKLDTKHLGPQQIQSFYTFDSVNLWFEELPKSIKTKQSGETRIAVQIHDQCVLARKTCAIAKVKEALTCEIAATTDVEAGLCWEACDEEEKGAEKKPKRVLLPKASASASALGADVALAEALAAATAVPVPASASARASASSPPAKVPPSKKTPGRK